MRFGCRLLTIESFNFFCDVKRLGGGWIPPQILQHRDEDNNALQSWPNTSKFTNDYPEQFRTILSQLEASLIFGGPWNALDGRIQIL